MTGERWALLKSLFGRALELEDAQRSNFLRSACAGDTSLYRSLTGLLLHHEAACPLFEGPMLTPERMAEMVAAGLRTFVPGEIVADRFRIQRFLAEGGMGEVYAADDLELNEAVALKTVRPLLANDETILAGFRQEIQLARKVTHRNVSRVFDLVRHETIVHGQPRTIFFLSMELLPGETLADRIRRTGPLPPAEARRIAAQLIAGLEAAHAAGIVHSDLKSGNVALVPEPDVEGGERVVIMDFGLAARTTTLAASTAEGLRGTPAYMAPEQVAHGAITISADIYALGVVLFEMTTGRLPFQGDSPRETAQLRLRQDAPRLRSWAPHAPAAWDRAVACCLHQDPVRRPASVSEVAVRLSGRLERRRVLLAGGLAAGIAGLAIAGAVWTLQPHRPTSQARAAAESARVKLVNVTQDGFLSAIQDFRRATELDPLWAGAWAELAYTYAAAANTKQVPEATALREARQSALRAIALDGRSAKAYGALGWVQSLDLDEWPNAEDNLRRAVALDSADPQLHYWLGVQLRKAGRFQGAEAEDRQALSLSHQADPAIWFELAFLYWTSGQLPRMEAFMRELLVAYPHHGTTRFLRARLLKEQGRFEEALAELNFSQTLQFKPVTLLAERASVEAHRGHAREALAMLEQLRQAALTQPVDGLLMAGVYARLGDLNSAFDLLEEAYARRDSTLLSLATSPVLQPLRGDPRYAALLRRLHFAP